MKSVKTLENPEEKILNMGFNDKKSSEEHKKIRLKILDIFHKWQKYKKMIDVYERYEHTKNFTNLLKNNKPEVVLEHLFITAGMTYNSEEFSDFSELIDKKKEENPDIDLRDITSIKSRIEISSIISEIDNTDIIPADLNKIAVIEGYGIYKAVNDIENGKDIETVKKTYDVTNEMIEKAIEKKAHFDKQEMRTLYDRVNKGEVPEAVYLVAGILEIGPGEAQNDLEGFGIIPRKNQDKEFNDETLIIYKEEPSRFVLDSIIMNDKYDPESKKMALDDYLNKVDENNKVKEAMEKDYRNKHDGKPSPQFNRELAQYMEEMEAENVKMNKEEKQKDEGYEIA